MIRVLIVDDHAIVREGLRQIVSETSDVTVGGEASTAADALDAIRKGGWDVVVLDLNLPDRSGLEVLSQIRASYPRLPVLILSMHKEASYAARALRAGAAGYITKEAAREQLIEAVRRVAERQRFIAPDMAESLAIGLLDRGGRPPHELLTDRELEVLQLIVTGRRPRDIAHQLGLSVKTVGAHRAHILQKLSVSSTAELVQYALEHRLLIR